MKQVLFATGNTEKFQNAKALCNARGIILKQFDIDTPEIQSEDPAEVVTHKVKAKFEQSGNKSIVVSDDSWAIPALNGFPGPYMKSIDHWFTPQNFLDLTAYLTDRRIFLDQYLAYIDARGLKIFHTQIPGLLATEARGEYGKPMQKIIKLDRDNGLTIAQVYDKGIQHSPERFDKETDVWNKFANWYLNDN